MNIAFFGTPRFATIILDELARVGLIPALIVSAPNAKAGRGLELTPPPTKTWALSHNIPCLQPEKIDDDFITTLRAKGYELFVVAAYVLNVHPSLLPKFRGASPIEGQILADDPEVGVTIMLIDAEVDHGPIIAERKRTISDWPPKASALEETLARDGGRLLAEVLPKWVMGEIAAHAQDHERATYTKKITKEDGLLDLSGDPRLNFLKIRAFDPWPGTYFFVERGGKKIRIKITDAKLTGGNLEILRVIPEGRREMSYEDFMRG